MNFSQSPWRKTGDSEQSLRKASLRTCLMISRLQRKAHDRREMDRSLITSRILEQACTLKRMMCAGEGFTR